MLALTQVNLQQHFGGAEVYTGFLCRALDSLGVNTRILVHNDATFWEQLALPSNSTLVPVNPNNLIASLSDSDHWLLGNGPLPSAILDSRKYLCTAIAHMPIQGRDSDSYLNHNMIFPVSHWVRDGLVDAGLPCWNEPLYGVSDLVHRAKSSQIIKTSKYDWDHRKMRDHIFSKLEPIASPFIKQPNFTKRSGVTFGIVSRITPIKQFPLLFSLLSPILCKFPEINIEIFGSGGYASIRDLKNALAPVHSRVRFWGHQSDVASIYNQIDYLLTGLPEKEALGLNIIESQLSGTPVLAPRAQPFTETIEDEVTGFLYTDPRLDHGEDFRKLINKILSLPTKLDPLQAVDHLEKFSLNSFINRFSSVIEWADKNISP